MKLSKIIKNIKDSSDELDRAKFDNNNNLISQISAFSEEDAKIMRFYTKDEVKSLTKEEKEEYEKQDKLRKLIIQKYNLFARLAKGVDNFAGR